MTVGKKLKRRWRGPLDRDLRTSPAALPLEPKADDPLGDSDPGYPGTDDLDGEDWEQVLADHDEAPNVDEEDWPMTSAELLLRLEKHAVKAEQAALAASQLADQATQWLPTKPAGEQIEACAWIATTREAEAGARAKACEAVMAWHNALVAAEAASCPE